MSISGNVMVMILLQYGEHSSIFDSLLGTCWKENKGKILHYGIIHHSVDTLQWKQDINDLNFLRYLNTISPNDSLEITAMETTYQ